uniref:UAP56-interacting factor n=1 Tax=Oreochromis aureus TaxID=47969 RepID=A0A668RRI7_OREAU
SMNMGDFKADRGKRTPIPDKVDMSLDDIIRLNKKEQQLRRQANVNRRPVKKKGRLIQGKGVSQRTAGPAQRGGGIPRGGGPKLRNRKVPPIVARRRGQGVITGLAARRPAALLKRAGTLNRSAFNQHRPCCGFIKVWESLQLLKPLPPVQQTQREARQATFLFRRGLKVQAQVQKPNPHTPPVRTRQWRTSTASSGILTVSIDNPTARTQPEPPTAWTLHPPAASVAPVKMETVEKKIPKGVPLQFDINSVGKPQTSMTLNERFRILKDRRAATAQSSKGSRFVTVG